jgi:hypothetical protein
MEMTRINEEYIYHALITYATAQVAGVTFYNPDNEPSFKTIAKWAMVIVDVDDQSTRSTEYAGEGRIQFDIGAKKAGNTYAAKKIAHSIMTAFANEGVTIAGASTDIGVAVFGKASSQSTGEVDGVLTHYVTLEFQVNTI